MFALDWIKANTYGAFAGNMEFSFCGGIFKNKNGDYLGSFDIPLGHNNVFSAELNDIMYTIEIADWRG